MGLLVSNQSKSVQNHGTDTIEVGLDVHTVGMLSMLLQQIAQSQSPRIILSLRPDEHMPEWLTHLVFLNNDFAIDSMGLKDRVLTDIQTRAKDMWTNKGSRELTEDETAFTNVARLLKGNEPTSPGASWTKADRMSYHRTYDQATGREAAVSRLSTVDGFDPVDAQPIRPGEALVEMNGVRVAYGDKVALGGWEQELDGKMQGGLWWTVRRGERWGVFGPNGKIPQSWLAVRF
jgi:hypothetical protein